MKKVESAGDKMKYQKNQIFHPERVKQEEESKKDKSQSAEKERQHLQRLKLEKAQKDGSDKSGSGRLSELVNHFKGKESVGQAQGVRRVSGTGPEDGVPAPEGER